MTLRIVETSTGPVLVDDDESVATSSTPTQLEELAEQLGVDADVFSARLREEVQRRRRERGVAWAQLDETLAKRENGC